MVNALFGAVFELQGIKNLVLGLEKAAAWGLLVSGEIPYLHFTNNSTMEAAFHKGMPSLKCLMATNTYIAHVVLSLQLVWLVMVWQ
jgi:hypothetical protein